MTTLTLTLNTPVNATIGSPSAASVEISEPSSGPFIGLWLLGYGWVTADGFVEVFSTAVMDICSASGDTPTTITARLCGFANISENPSQVQVTYITDGGDPTYNPNPPSQRPPSENDSQFTEAFGNLSNLVFSGGEGASALVGLDCLNDSSTGITIAGGAFSYPPFAVDDSFYIEGFVTSYVGTGGGAVRSGVSVFLYDGATPFAACPTIAVLHGEGGQFDIWLDPDNDFGMQRVLATMNFADFVYGFYVGPAPE